jgi:nicotinamide-nucleotide amidase
MTAVYNAVQTAPGMADEKEDIFISLSGVPYEMNIWLKTRNNSKVVKNTNVPIYYELYTYGQGESLVSERIEDWGKQSS